MGDDLLHGDLLPARGVTRPVDVGEPALCDEADEQVLPLLDDDGLAARGHRCIRCRLCGVGGRLCCVGRHLRCCLPHLAPLFEAHLDKVGRSRQEAVELHSAEHCTTVDVAARRSEDLQSVLVATSLRL